MKNDEWYTPIWLFKKLDSIFHFDLDPCGCKESHMTEIYYDKDTDGLKTEWFGNVFCNPPYSNIEPWVEKAKNYNGLTVLLLPNRTDSSWFHKYAKYAHIYFLRGRLKFSNSKSNAPFGSMIMVFNNEKIC